MNNGCRIAENGSICNIDIYTKNGELYCSHSGVEIKDFNIEHRSNSTALSFSIEGRKYFILNPGTVVLSEDEEQLIEEKIRNKKYDID